MIRILFVCTHNGARSQFAEAFTRLFAEKLEKNIIVESAGLQPGVLNKYVVKVLQDDYKIDISNKKPQSVIELFNRNKEYDYVITVCSREAEKQCPIFPGITKRLNWPFEDPSDFSGDYDTILLKVRKLGNDVKEKVFSFIKELEEKD